MNCGSWLSEKKKELLIILLGCCIYFSIITYAMGSLGAPRMITGSLMFDSIIYLIVCFIITILIVSILLFILSFTWSISYKTISVSENGVIDKNLEKLNVGTLIERLEEYSTESLVLLKDNHIVIIGKDSIKLKEE